MLVQAVDVVNTSKDTAAAYYLARQLESAGKALEAIQFFQRAGRFGHAVRLAKAAGLDSEVMQCAIQSSKEAMVDAARYVMCNACTVQDSEVHGTDFSKRMVSWTRLCSCTTKLGTFPKLLTCVSVASCLRTYERSVGALMNVVVVRVSLSRSG